MTATPVAVTNTPVVVTTSPKTELQKVSPWMTNIGRRFGQVKDLEKRMDIMEGLDPLMDGILQKMNEVTDHSNIIKM